MRLLYVSTEAPYPPRNGVRIPLYHSMRLMREAGHEIGLLTVSDDRESLEAELETSTERLGLSFAKGVALNARSRHSLFAASLVNRRMYFLERYANERFAKLLVQTTSEFTPAAIHFDLVTTTEYRKYVPRDVRCIASVNDSYAFSLQEQLRTTPMSLARRVYRSAQSVAAKRYERTAYNAFDCVHVVSENDRSYLKRLGVASEIVVLSNGVDPELFELSQATHGNSDVLFVGALGGANLTYVRTLVKQIWPQVMASVPNAKLKIIGNAGDEAAALIQEIREAPGVQYMGYVERLSEAYRMGGISVVPMDKRCGIINKAIEAMVAGHVVLGYPSTFSGIPEARPDVNTVTCLDANDFAERLVTLLRDPTRLKAMQCAASEVVKTNYRWETRAEELEQIYSARDSIADHQRHHDSTAEGRASG